QELQRRRKNWHVQTEKCIHASDMAELVGVRQMAAIPGDEEITLVVRRGCQVKCVTGGIRGHQLMLNVCVYDLGNRGSDFRHRQGSDQLQGRLLARVCTIWEL